MAKLIHVGVPAVSPDECAYHEHEDDTRGPRVVNGGMGVYINPGGSGLMSDGMDDTDGPFAFAKKSGYGRPWEDGPKYGPDEI